MRKYLLLILCFSLIASVYANQRKKVAVVLGGGGAKGVAHIGVLKVLEEAGIPIDIVTGTSMGAIVGGLYAIGYSPDEIKQMVHSQDWEMLLSDKVKRSSLFFPEKENSERYILTLPFGKEKKDRVIDGVIKGQNLQNLFSDLTLGYHDSVDFNKFNIPFACVAVDLVSGKDHVFHNGSLPLAMRASMAIPAVFTPVRLDSMVLVDGGLNNNYPADVARQMGAEIIIGVDLATSDLRNYERLYSPGDIVTQIIALHGHEKYAHNVDKTDLLFRPDMEPYRSSSFTSVALDTMMMRGEKDARSRWNEIIALKEKIGIADSSQSVRTLHAYKPVQATDTFSISTITFQGADPDDVSWLRKISRLKENSRITLADLQRAMNILVGSNAYSYVNYKLSGENQQELILILQPKSVSSLSLGVRFDSEEIIAVLLNGTYDYRRRFHSKFSITGRIGAKQSYARLDYAIERSALRNFNLAYQFIYQDLDIYEKGNKIVNTSYGHHIGEFAYSDMNWLNFKFKLGLRYEYFNYNNFLFTTGNDQYIIKPEGFLNYFASAHLETLDRQYFPTKGVSLQADYTFYTDNLVKYNGGTPFSAIRLNFKTVVPITSHFSMLPSLYGRTLIGRNIAYPFLNVVGGETFGRFLPQQLPFAGINNSEIFSNSVVIGRIEMRQRIAGRNYISLIGNFGLHDDNFFHILDGKAVWGGSLGYSYNSLAGPLSATFGLSNQTNKLQFFLNLGYYF